jgi:hypothetical protein
MDRFTEDSPTSTRPDRDEDGRPDVPDAQPKKCFYCECTGGTPYLLIGNELRCSRYFEEFTDEELVQYLIDSGGPSIHQVVRSMERKVA